MSLIGRVIRNRIGWNPVTRKEFAKVDGIQIKGGQSSLALMDVGDFVQILSISGDLLEVMPITAKNGWIGWMTCNSCGHTAEINANCLNCGTVNVRP